MRPGRCLVAKEGSHNSIVLTPVAESHGYPISSDPPIRHSLYRKLVRIERYLRLPILAKDPVPPLRHLCQKKSSVTSSFDPLLTNTTMKRSTSSSNMVKNPSWDNFAKHAAVPGEDDLSFASDLYQLATQDEDSLHTSWRVFTSMAKSDSSDNLEGAEVNNVLQSPPAAISNGKLSDTLDMVRLESGGIVRCHRKSTVSCIPLVRT